LVRARDLVRPYPVVELESSALKAAHLLAQQDLPGLVVVDDNGRPMTVLAGTEVLQMAVPAYCQDDPSLARVIDEAAADVFVRALEGRTVRECLPEQHHELPVVGPNATVLEIAAIMARTHSPLVAVVDRQEGLLGAVTLDALMDWVTRA